MTATDRETLNSTVCKNGVEPASLLVASLLMYYAAVRRLTQRRAIRSEGYQLTTVKRFPLRHSLSCSFGLFGLSHMFG